MPASMEFSKWEETPEEAEQYTIEMFTNNPHFCSSQVFDVTKEELLQIYEWIEENVLR